MTDLRLAVRPYCEKANDSGADKTEKDQDANDQVVPSSSPHGLVLEPWLFVLSNQPVTLESTFSTEARNRACLEGGESAFAEVACWCGRHGEKHWQVRRRQANGPVKGNVSRKDNSGLEQRCSQVDEKTWAIMSGDAAWYHCSGLEPQRRRSRHG